MSVAQHSQGTLRYPAITCVCVSYAEIKHSTATQKEKWQMLH